MADDPINPVSEVEPLGIPDIPEPPEDNDAAMRRIAGMEPRGHAEWRRWKQSPSPATLSQTLKAVQPIIDSSVARFPGFNKAVLGGEAKRLAIQAIRSYNPDEGTQLSSHIFNHLRPLARHTQEIGRAISVPRETREGVARLVNAQRDFSEEHGREPHDEELQTLLGVSRKQLAKLHASRHYEFAEGQVDESPDVTQDEDPHLRLWVDYIYHDLNDRDKLIVDHRIGRNGRPILSSEETAAKLGISQTYVNRRAQEIAQKILEGVNSTKQRNNPTASADEGGEE